ncbi:MAG: hypothetical protein LBS16_02730 [Prevotellaceae bacterium]|jgi:hypothetical protein|nr:hypothetical protein [Prevotellaceae bacterium]
MKKVLLSIISLIIFCLRLSAVPITASEVSECLSGANRNSSNDTARSDVLRSAPNINCIAFLDLNSPTTTCTYGNFDNPYLGIGVVNNRHTIHTNPNELDSRTGNRLRTIPVGESASVRLGNWSTGAQAESITYTYQVDSETAILVLKYAVVLQSPSHNRSQQPKFKLEILNSKDQLINSSCGFAEFIPRSNTQDWNTYSGLVWKDWTTVGLNLQSLAGEQIKVRLTTYDCSQSGHYGYAYFTIACAQGTLEGASCGGIATTFTAPAGFNYKWYPENDPTNIVSTSQTFISQGNDSVDYLCRVEFVEDSSCYFVLRAAIRPRLPVAQATYTCHIDCDNVVTFNNLSHIVFADSVTTDPCDAYEWYVNDVLQSTDENPSFILPNAGATYEVKLVASLAGGLCKDSTVFLVDTQPVSGVYNLYQADTICRGETYTFRSREFTETTYWSDTLTTYQGCDSILTLDLTVLEKSFTNLDVTICQGETYSFAGKELSSADIYTDTLKTVIHHCDSIITLDLKVIDLPVKTMDSVTICQGDSILFGGNYLFTERWYEHTLAADTGCDTIVRLYLTVNPVHVDTVEQTICAGDSVLWGGQWASATGYYPSYYLNQYGCDSTQWLHLTVNPVHADTVEQTICDGDSLLWGGQWAVATGYYPSYYLNQYGCDSTRWLHLTVNPVHVDTVEQAICAGDSLLWGGQWASAAGYYLSYHLNQYGCDSTRWLHLTINPVHIDTVEQIICSGDSLLWGGQWAATAGYYPSYYLNQYGCDSTRWLHLTVSTVTIPSIKHTAEINVLHTGSIAFTLPPEYTYTINGVQNGTLTGLDEGSYIIVFHNENGCSSAPQSLLIELICLSVEHDLPARICADDNQMTVVFETPVTSYSLSFDEKAKAAGFVDGTFNGDKNSVHIALPENVRPDIYNVEIALVAENCNKPVRITVALEALYSSGIMKQKWNNVIALLNEHYNGGYRFVPSYRWYKNGQLLIGEDKSYIYLGTGNSFDFTEEYSIQVTREDDGVTLFSCPLTPSLHIDLTQLPVIAVRSQVAAIISPVGGTYHLYALTGHKILSGSFTPDNNQFAVPERGVYMVELLLDNGSQFTDKMVVY